MKLVPEHVKGARAMLRLSAEALGELAGVAAQTIQNFEVGRHQPTEDTLLRLQTVLEEHGITFTNGDSPGVKLDRKKARKPTLQ